MSRLDELDALLNAPTAPETLEQDDIDQFRAVAGGFMIDIDDWGYGLVRFDFHRRDGDTVNYCRWADEDGIRWYRFDVLQKRPSFKAETAKLLDELRGGHGLPTSVGEAVADFEREVSPAVARRVLFGDEPGELEKCRRGTNAAGDTD